eukprot:scaffold3473_cov122-Isochrysis_galbana.AAC.7
MATAARGTALYSREAPATVMAHAPGRNRATSHNIKRKSGRSEATSRFSFTHTLRASVILRV